MNEYILERHIRNLETLNNIYYTPRESIQSMFSAINDVADFLQENLHYTEVNEYNEAVKLVVDIIEFCNSDTYSYEHFLLKYDDIIYSIVILQAAIHLFYKINVYFMGKDRYGLINTIINENIRFSEYKEGIENSFKWDNRAFNILIISEDKVANFDKQSDFDSVIHYDNYMIECLNKVNQFYFNNYDYHYLVNAMNKAKNNKTEEIVVGHSHSLFGVDATKLNENMVNLSLLSQDLYYSIRIAKDIIDSNKNIKKCYVGTSYWSLHFDLSRSEKIEVSRMENVYYPIFRDSHNNRSLSKRKVIDLTYDMDQLSSIIFNIEALNNCLCKIIFESNSSYFNRNIDRKSILNIDKDQLMDIQFRSILGKIRTDYHNKLLKYEQTRDENITLLKEFLNYLNDKDIEAVIVNFPTSTYYKKLLSDQFITYFNRVIQNLKEECNFNFLDLNMVDLFIDEDFVDADHMSELGAMKISEIIASSSGVKAKFEWGSS